MRRLSPTLLVASLLLSLPAGTPAETMAYPCFRATTAPIVDGVIPGDRAWEGMPVATGFSKLGDGYTDAKQTAFRACWDADALYLAVTCEEPDVALMKPSVRDGGDTWLDDGIEAFLQPAPDATVVQFVVTAAAAKGGYEGAPDFLKYQAAAHLGADFYSLEIRIPFELVGPAPSVGDAWRGNVCRNIWTAKSGGDRFTCWAPLQTRFLEPEHYAALDFSGPPPDAARAQQLTEQLNRPYRAELARRLRAVAAKAGDYTPTLNEAAQDPRFGEQARDLLTRWGQLTGILQGAERTPVTDLRRALQGANTLTQESYDVKYAYLIAHVLGD